MDIKIGGKVNPTVADYSVQEEATPVVAGDEAGAIPQITATSMSDDAQWLSAKQRVEVYDELHGQVSAVVRNTSMSGGETSLTGDSRMFALMQERLADGFKGTLGGAFHYYLGLCGITVGIAAHPSISERAVVYPAWLGEVWVHLKKMCAAENVEIALVNNTMVLRPTREVSATSRLATGHTTTTDVTDFAEAIEIYNYNTEYRTKGLVYPPGQWDNEADRNVAAGSGYSSGLTTIPYGEVMTLEVEIDAYLETIHQPVCVRYVPVQTSNRVGDSIYSVTYQVEGKDGDSITRTVWPDEWEKAGAFVKVEKKPDTLNTLIITVSSGDMPRENAPYSLGTIRDGENVFGTLYIVGDGIFTNKQKITVSTGVEPEDAVQVIGETVDNEFISSRTQAYEAVYDLIGKYCGVSVVISGSAPNLELTGNAFGSFGETAGARYLSEDAMYRLSSATISPGNTDFTAGYDTLFMDWNTAWGPDATLADVEAYFARDDKSFLDVARSPLRTG